MTTRSSHTSMEVKASEAVNGKMTKGELDNLLKAFRLNAKAAKASIINLGAKLKAEFEIQLNTTYPETGDPVWEEEYQALVKEWETRQSRVDKRCDQRGIPKRFRPRIGEPHWFYGGDHTFLKLRPELRRLAYAQIDSILKDSLEQLELSAAQVQLSLLSHGFITDEAKGFFAQLPTVASLIPPLKMEEIVGLLEGKSFNHQELLPECLPN